MESLCAEWSEHNLLNTSLISIRLRFFQPGNTQKVLSTSVKQRVEPGTHPLHSLNEIMSSFNGVIINIYSHQTWWKTNPPHLNHRKWRSTWRSGGRFESFLPGSLFNICKKAAMFFFLLLPTAIPLHNEHAATSGQQKQRRNKGVKNDAARL